MSEDTPTQPVKRERELGIGGLGNGEEAVRSEPSGRSEPGVEPEVRGSGVDNLGIESKAARSEPGARSEPEVRSESAARAEPVEGEEKSVRAFWREMGREMVRGAARKIENAGRVVMIVDAVLVGLYANLLAFSNLRPFGSAALPLSMVLIYLLPVLFLLFSLMFAGGIFLIERIDVDPRSSRGVRSAHTETARNKLLFLRTSILLLGLAVVAAAAALWVYLVT